MMTIRIRALLLLGVLAFGADAVRAAEDPGLMLEMSAIRAEVVAADSLADEFAGLAGSTGNAQLLVAGMRNAKPVALKAKNARQRPAHFTPSAQPMSFTDIHTALSLAQAQLKARQIDSPTPAQIRASLAGGKLRGANGETQHVVGILPMHRRGMSWEEIAQALRVASPKRTLQTSNG